MRISAIVLNYSLANDHFITEAIFNESDHEGGRVGGQKYPKIDHVVYGWPLN